MLLITRTNGFLERWIYIVMPLMMLVGIAAGSALEGWVTWIPFLFMFLTFQSSLSADVRKFVELLKKPAMFLAFMISIHFVLPFAAHKTASLFFSTRPELAIGITLIMVLPLGVTSIFWVAFNKGNVAIALSLVSLDTLISPFLIPISLSAIAGSSIQLDVQTLIVNLLKLVLIPALLGIVSGEWMRRSSPPQWVKPGASLAGKFCLYAVVLLNAASISEPIRQIGGEILFVFILIITLMIAGYAASLMIALLFRVEPAGRIAITYSGGVRNYTVGVVLASAFFGPLTALPVLLAMLLQHPIALIVYSLFRRNERNTEIRYSPNNHTGTM